MQYTVCGTGMVGRTLAEKLVSLGHEVVIGTRDPQATLARTEPDRFGSPPFSEWQQSRPQIRLAPFDEAAAFGGTLMNATSGTQSLSALAAAGAENLAGKVLIDVANPLDFSRGMPPALDPVGDDSLGEQIQRTFPGARVVKTLNTMNCRVMVDPGRVSGEHNVFVSGDDPEAKKQVTGLLMSFGWPPSAIIDLGDLSTARGVEMLLPLWLSLAGAVGHTDFNFHVQGAHAQA